MVQHETAVETVILQLICAFALANAKYRLSHDAAHWSVVRDANHFTSPPLPPQKTYILGIRVCIKFEIYTISSITIFTYCATENILLSAFVDCISVFDFGHPSYFSKVFRMPIIICLLLFFSLLFAQNIDFRYSSNE